MRGRDRALRVLLVALPSLFASARLGDPFDALTDAPVPPPHSVDVWGGHTDGLDMDLAGNQAAVRAQLRQGPQKLLAGLSPTVLAQQQEPEVEPPAGTGDFLVVGSVAVLSADGSTVIPKDTGFGIIEENMQAIARRFISTFGDDYDQIAVFLAFYDRASTAALAYQQPVKNDVRGIGLGLFDRTKLFGSKGRMQTMLNMKRISLYGRDAAADPDNGLYAVWAQEAAHRWLVYFRWQHKPEDMKSETLLGRQKAHWARGVQAGGSIMDGYDWKDNGDNTFTPGRRGFQYGILDQYGMGLIKASEVPPFFLLEDIKDPTTGADATLLGAAGRYSAKKTVLTVQDLVIGSGARDPVTDAAASDLRMAVVLLAPPGVPASQLVGEAFQIDNTRRLWTDFYNTAGGGKGMVCTDLLRPCREEAVAFSDITLAENKALGADGDGVLAPGEPFVLTVKVSNSGSMPVRPEIYGAVAGAEVAFDGSARAPATLAPNDSTTLTLTGSLGSAACNAPLTFDLRAKGVRGRSRVLQEVFVGTRPKQIEDFEGASLPAGWRVNPDGDDTSAQGRWAWGTPDRSLAFDYTLQPGAAYSGKGAFVTGLSAVQEDNVDGRTTLESPELAVKDVRAPALSYAVYFVAAEFGQEVLVPASAGLMRVLASADGGKTWTEIDRLTGMATGWRRRVVRLGEKLGDAVKNAAGVRFRFVAEETSQAQRPVTEVALDEVGIFEESATCGLALPPPVPRAGGNNPAPKADDDGGCSYGGRAPGGPLFAAAMALWLHRRARRSRLS